MHAIDHGAHQRIAVLENQMNRLNLQLDKLEGKFDTVQMDVTSMKSSMGEVSRDMKWMRDELMPLVRGTSKESKSAKNESNVAKALGLIGLLIAILAGVLGLSNVASLASFGF